ncbi:MAG: hypothetical protein IKN04_13525 [Clostridia bacterium]|nr:hypothetical protein [Clostridia bacterium]
MSENAKLYKSGNAFFISEKDTEKLLEMLDKQEHPIIEISPLMVEDDVNGGIIIRHSEQKEGLLRLTRREALALAEIIRNHCEDAPETVCGTETDARDAAKATSPNQLSTALQANRDMLQEVFASE